MESIESVSSWALDLALAAMIGIAGLAALVTRSRGGRFRGLPGWVGFWVVIGALLFLLTHVRAQLSLVCLGVLMLVGLRTYFFLAPVRPRDRFAILAAYVAVPWSLYPGFTGSEEGFLATVPVVLVLLFPMLLSIGPSKEGLLDSMGRILLGVLLYVFCAAHLGLFVRREPGLLALFGLFVVAAELPQRLAGRPGRGVGAALPAFGVLAGLLFTTGIGFGLGPWAGLGQEDAARAGVLVLIAVTMGSFVTGAVVVDLDLSATDTRVGRAALLDRLTPTVYAAPVYFHYLNYFA